MRLTKLTRLAKLTRLTKYKQENKTGRQRLLQLIKQTQIFTRNKLHSLEPMADKNDDSARLPRYKSPNKTTETYHLKTTKKVFN